MKFIPSLLLAAAVFMTFAGTGFAQTTYYFDPNHTSGSNLGGTGTWDTGSAMDWYLPGNTPADTSFPGGSLANANFQGTPGTVTVGAGGVNPNYITVSANTGNYTLGNTTSDGTITFTSGTSANGSYFELDGSSAATLNAPINVVVPDIANAQYQDNFSNNSSQTLTINSNITLSGGQVNAAVNYHSVDLDSNGSGRTIFNGTLINATTGPGGVQNPLFFSLNGTAELGSTANISQAGALSFNGTTYIDPGATIGNSNINLSGTSSFLYTNGAVTFASTGGIYSGHGATIGGSTADVSTYNITIAPYATPGTDPATVLTAVPGGRVNFDAPILTGTDIMISPTVSAAHPATAGPAVVSLNYGNEYTGTTTVGAGATLLLNNDPSNMGNNNGYNGGNSQDSGSATGSNTSYFVNVDGGGTLGGHGQTVQTVMVAAGGIIAPGDPGQANLLIDPSIATLNLKGGLTMASGSTLAFKLDGSSNDEVNLGSGALTLNGTINVDFSSLGSVNVYHFLHPNYYTVATGTGAWSSDPTFDITAPAGYVVNQYLYGYNNPNEPTTETLEVDFKAVPEPSTYALMIGGLAFLAYCVRRKNRMV